MALLKLVRRNYGRKWPMSIKYENLHSFKEGMILLCQSILETRRISHLHGSPLFTIPLKTFETYKRPSNLSIPEYINEFEKLLTSKNLRWRLLKNVNLKRSKGQLIKATLSDLNYVLMKDQLISLLFHYQETP